MSTTTASRRRDRRYALGKGAGSTVEFVHPSPHGPLWCLSLLDISVSGLSFVLDDEISGIDEGTTISDVAVRVGDVEVCGELLIMHVSTAENRRLCGALFYPSTDADLKTVHDLLAGIGLNQSD